MRKSADDIGLGPKKNNHEDENQIEKTETEEKDGGRRYVCTVHTRTVRTVQRCRTAARTSVRTSSVPARRDDVTKRSRENRQERQPATDTHQSTDVRDKPHGWREIQSPSSGLDRKVLRTDSTVRTEVRSTSTRFAMSRPFLRCLSASAGECERSKSKDKH